ncbi:hypothetical protein LTR37_001627 [Vermiconidia calcicola]|uniref:Uncharacterized protein n=1 Tax=Vermiconidia calcicola TaxID=1690605 RepID=A0ACC3NVL8_9PEZI|nr:hypothetical protein LTR37_001627 [Vermiconidia calcicola]
MSAVAKVFGIPELLEQILLKLDMHELFLFEGVNTVFRDILHSSKAIRTAMYLEASTKACETANPTLNPMLARGFAQGVCLPMSVTSHRSPTSPSNRVFSTMTIYLTSKIDFTHASRRNTMHDYFSIRTPGSWRTTRVYSAECEPTIVLHLEWCDRQRHHLGPNATLGDLVDWIRACILSEGYEERFAPFKAVTLKPAGTATGDQASEASSVC